jgi:hypothetical protein
MRGLGQMSNTPEGLRSMGTLLSVIGHGILAGKYLAKCCNSLNSQSLMYVGDRQSPPDLKACRPHNPKVMTHHLIPYIPT